MAISKSTSAVLKDVCVLSRNGKFGEASKLIFEVAQISPDEQKEIPVAEMGDYIQKKCKHPNVRKMMQVVRAFWSLSNLYYREKEPDAYEAKSCIDNLEKILPILNKEQQLFVKYWQSNCYIHADEGNDEVRYNLLMEVMKGTSKGKNSSLMASCMAKINDMDISVNKKYEGLKLAKSKMNAKHPIYHSYDDVLGKCAQRYYDDLLEDAGDNRFSYEERNKTYDKALEVVNDFMTSLTNKNKNKLTVLERQILLQQSCNDKDRLLETCRKKKNILVQLDIIRKKTTPYNKEEMWYG